MMPPGPQLDNGEIKKNYYWKIICSIVLQCLKDYCTTSLHFVTVYLLLCLNSRNLLRSH